MLDRITAPTLISRGELSPVLPRDMADKLRAAIHGARLVEIPASYHHLVLDNPAGFVQELDRFVTSVLQHAEGRLDARRDSGSQPGG